MGCVLFIVELVKGRGGSSVTAGLNTPLSISLLRPKPATLFTLKPTACKPRLTTPAEVKVAKVVLAWLALASAVNNCSVHMLGFLLGAKPSKHQASILPVKALKLLPASPSNKSTLMRGCRLRR